MNQAIHGEIQQIDGQSEATEVAFSRYCHKEERSTYGNAGFAPLRELAWMKPCLDGEPCCDTSK